MNTTTDTILDGAVELEQPAHGAGYRFNVDSVHLARFVAPHVTGGHLVDLGAGVGTVALCIAALASPTRLTLVELDPAACVLADRNVRRAGWSERAEVIQADLACWRPAGLCPQYVVANPPYTREGAGRTAKVARVHRARHGEVRVFMRAAARLMGGEASFALCYPAHSLVQLLAAAGEFGLGASRVAFVHARAALPARLALVELRAGHTRDPAVCAPVVEMP